MEKTSSEKIRLGIFVIGGLILFVLAIYYIGSRQQIFEKTEHLTTLFNNVNGLLPGNNVRYSGINAGTVRAIDMVDDSTIRVDMIIDKKLFAHIKKDAIATIGSDGLVGSMIINIIPGSESQVPVEPGDMIQSYTRISTNDILNTLNVTNENAAILTSDLLKITGQIIEGKGAVGMLINDTTMAGSIARIMHYLELTSKGTAESVRELNVLMATLTSDGTLISTLSDTTVANQFRNTMTGLEQSSIEMQSVIENLNGAVLNMKEGKGAINYLSNDEEMVERISSVMTNLDSTLVQLRGASERLNEDLEALKHNVFFRGYFKKLEKEAKREKK